ncbi:MAG TPA: 6-carboxytetrahydropterin synthase [Opitutaceae bacterium]|nr:6-carboxytetrahydropterin synthase [Opitutaceae bacterium]
MFTCSKVYADIPFAHRQHRHGGHCALVHGHTWSLRFTFACEHTDENCFVVDFGGLRYIREWIDRTLDHACLFNADDPLRDALVAAAPGAWKPLVVENCTTMGEIVRESLATLRRNVRRHAGPGDVFSFKD